MLDFAVKMSQNAHEISDSDMQTLRENGFDMEEIWDIGSIVALFALSNRLANMAEIKPNPEFYNMGRGGID